MELEAQPNGAPEILLEQEIASSDLVIRKASKKGKWKGWNWLHNSTSRNVSNDPEEILSKKKMETLQESPVFAINYNSRRFSADVLTQRRKDEEFSAMVPPFGSDSPKRRTLKCESSSPNRMSAGARLYKVFEEDTLSVTDSENEMKMSGKPNSMSFASAKQI